MAQAEKPRIDYFDNLKAVLIILVVLGHVIELTAPAAFASAHRFIYLFHIPLFTFCSGYMAKFDAKKLLTGGIWCYAVFQLLYCLFARHLLGKEAEVQFSTPYWIMWYLLALVVWTLALPLLDAATNSPRNIALTLGGAVALGLLAGFDETVGYAFSFARVLTFFPFFAAGFCARKALGSERLLTLTAQRGTHIIAYGGTALVLAFLLLEGRGIRPQWLYGSFSYEAGHFTALVRLGNYLAAVVLSLALMAAVPRKRTFLSNIGQRSVQVYLLHGFALLAADMALERLGFEAQEQFAVLLALSALMVPLLATTAVGQAISPLLHFPLHARRRAAQ